MTSTTQVGMCLAARSQANPRMSTIMRLSSVSFRPLEGQSTRVNPDKSYSSTQNKSRCQGIWMWRLSLNAKHIVSYRNRTTQLQIVAANIEELCACLPNWLDLYTAQKSFLNHNKVVALICDHIRWLLIGWHWQRLQFGTSEGCGHSHSPWSVWGVLGYISYIIPVA